MPKQSATANDPDGLLFELYDQCRIVLRIRDDIVHHGWDARRHNHPLGETHERRLQRELEVLKLTAERMQLGLFLRLEVR